MKNYLGYVLLVLIITLNVILIIEFNDNTKVTTSTKEIIEKQSVDKKVILFSGDSITDYYDLAKFYDYDDKLIYNSGIAGYKTTDIIKRYDNMITQYNADKFFLLIGTNDVSRGTSNKEIVENTKEILMRARKNHQGIELYYISIYPINSVVDGSKAGKRKNSTIREINKTMKSYCEENNITYVDLYSKLADKNDRLKEDYTYDGLHLNSNGYEVVTRELKPYIEK